MRNRVSISRSLFGKDVNTIGISCSCSTHSLSLQRVGTVGAAVPFFVPSLPLESSNLRLSGMAIKFVLLVNKQGQTRLAKYTDASMLVEERRALEGEIVRRCLARSEKQVKNYNYTLLS